MRGYDVSARSPPGGCGMPNVYHATTLQIASGAREPALPVTRRFLRGYHIFGSGEEVGWVAIREIPTVNAPALTRPATATPPAARRHAAHALAPAIRVTAALHRAWAHPPHAARRGVPHPIPGPDAPATAMATTTAPVEEAAATAAMATAATPAAPWPTARTMAAIPAALARTPPPARVARAVSPATATPAARPRACLAATAMVAAMARPRHAAARWPIWPVTPRAACHASSAPSSRAPATPS